MSRCRSLARHGARPSVGCRGRWRSPQRRGDADRSAADPGRQEPGCRVGARAAEAARRRERAAGRRRDRAPLGGASRRPRHRRSADSCRRARRTPPTTSAPRRCIWPARTAARRWSSGCSRPAPTPNAALLNGETALMTCARTGDAEAVKALLARGADVNAKEHEHHQTALMWAAAQTPSRTSSQLLIEARRRCPRALAHLPADRRRRADAARRPRRAELHRAARRQHAAAVRRAGRRRRIGAAAAEGGRRRERRAAGRRQRAGARGPQRPRAASRALLLEKGADPERRRQRLHRAARGGPAEAI